MLMTVAVRSLVNMLAPPQCGAYGGARRRPNGLFDRDRTRRRVPAIAAAAFLLCVLPASGRHGQRKRQPQVDAARMKNADRDAANWMSYGRTYSEQRFSPLDTDHDGQCEAARPRLVRRPRYQSRPGGDAAGRRRRDVRLHRVEHGQGLRRARPASCSGPTIPQVPRELGVKGCCDVVNRGVAAWNGKVYVGTFDGRLIALDARTGKPVWSVVTGRPEQALHHHRGAARRARDGAHRQRAAASTASAATSPPTTPRPASTPGASTPCPAIRPSRSRTRPMAMAAKTWSGEWWKLGGGGTVWDAISYDPELNLVYFGVGNGLEWARNYRSAEQGRQPVPVLDRRAERRHRRVRLALPGDARRGVGLRRRRSS